MLNMNVCAEQMTHPGDLWGSEVYDLPKLLGVEDRLHSLLQHRRQDKKKRYRKYSPAPRKTLRLLYCFIISTLASMRSRRFSTIIGSLVNSSNRYCHSQVSWPNVPLVTKNIPLQKKPKQNKTHDVRRKKQRMAPRHFINTEILKVPYYSHFLHLYLSSQALVEQSHMMNYLKKNNKKLQISRKQHI